MSTFIKLDKQLVLGRMGWQPDGEQAIRWAPNYSGILCGSELKAKSSELVVNSKLSLPLDCSIQPHQGLYAYHAVVVPNPRLFEVAEVSYPSIILTGSERTRPILHLRGLKKFDLADLDYVASIHLID